MLDWCVVFALRGRATRDCCIVIRDALCFGLLGIAA